MDFVPDDRMSTDRAEETSIADKNSKLANGRAGNCQGRKGRGWAPGTSGEASTCGRLRLEDVEPDARGAIGEKSELAGGALRYVDDAATSERTAIRDRDHDAAVVREVRHAHLGSERERSMRGRQPMLVVGPTAGGAVSVVFAGVVRRQPEPGSAPTAARKPRSGGRAGPEH